MAKYTGAGALVEVDVAGDANFVQVGCTTDITPPPEVKADVDLTCQTDAATDAQPGIEEMSQFTFTEMWDVGAASNPIDTLYTSGARVDWRVTFTDGTTTATITFKGYVKGKTPSTVGGNDGVLREVTVTRTGPITEAAT